MVASQILIEYTQLLAFKTTLTADVGKIPLKYHFLEHQRNTF